MNEQEQNPYAAPAEAGEARSVRFTLDDELRKQISTTATLMIVAGVVQLLPTVVFMLRTGFSGQSAVWTALFGVIPAFVAIAGVSLHRVAASGEVETLLAGFRQLYVAFLIKGVMLCLVIGLMLLGFAMAVFGVGVGFAKLF